jgi:hypothetical protein
LRHSEIARLDWQDIDLAEGFIEVKPVEGTKSDETRRIVPIKDNLKIFMLPLSKKSGKVISVANTTKQLLKAAADTGDAAKEIKLWLGNTMRFDTLTFPLASPNVATCPALPKKPETARMLYA